MDPYGDLWFFDPIDVCTTIIKDPVIRSSMYFGLRQLVAEESQLWHSPMWGESILGASGQYYFYEQAPQDPIFQGDCVFYRSEKNPYHIGLIREIVNNFMPDASQPGEVMVILDEIIPRRGLQSFFNESQFEECDTRLKGNWFLTQDSPQLIPIANVRRRLEQCTFGKRVAFGPLKQHQPIIVRRKPDRSNPKDIEDLRSGTFDFGFENIPSFHPSRIHIDQLVTIKHPHLIREVEARHRSRGELEIEVYGRHEIIQKFVQTSEGSRKVKVYSLPTTQFSDGFALFGKGTASYFSMLGIYITPANLSCSQRELLINQYPLALGPMGTDLDAATSCIGPGSRKLAWGIQIRVNGENILLVSFDMGKIGSCTPLL